MLPYRKVEAHRQELTSRHARHFQDNRRFDWSGPLRGISGAISTAYRKVRDLATTRTPRQAV